MAVVECTESWRDEEITTEGSYQERRRGFSLLVDNAETALDDCARYSGLPGWGAHHPSDYYLTARRTQLRLRGSKAVEAIVTYSNRASRLSETSSNPMEQPDQVRWYYSTLVVKVDEDVDGNHICNKAGEDFDPPPTKEIYIKHLVVRRNSQSSLGTLADTLQGKVNSAEFLGWAAGSARIVNITEEKMYDGDLAYWQQTIEIAFMPLAHGWDLRLLNAGYRDVNGETFVDAAGVPRAKPTLLDGSGAETGTANWLPFGIYESASFAVLNISNPAA